MSIRFCLLVTGNFSLSEIYYLAEFLQNKIYLKTIHLPINNQIDNFRWKYSNAKSINFLITTGNLYQSCSEKVTEEEDKSYSLLYNLTDKEKDRGGG